MTAKQIARGTICNMQLEIDNYNLDVFFVFY